MEDSKPPRTRKGGWVNPKTLPKNEDGRPQCRWCSGSVMPPRRTFCSDACVHEHRIRTNTKYMRQCVYRRDHGICAECKQDTKKIACEAKKHRANNKTEEYNKLLETYGIPKTRKLWNKGFVVLQNFQKRKTVNNKNMQKALDSHKDHNKQHNKE